MRCLRLPRGESGAVTAEAAVVIPVLVLVAFALTWLVSLAVTQVRVVDAARETARAVARGDDESAGVGLGLRVAPDGARITVRDEGETIRVRVTAPVRGPGGVFGFLPAYRASAEAVSWEEPGP